MHALARGTCASFLQFSFFVRDFSLELRSKDLKCIRAPKVVLVGAHTLGSNFEQPTLLRFEVEQIFGHDHCGKGKRRRKDRKETKEGSERDEGRIGHISRCYGMHSIIRR